MNFTARSNRLRIAIADDHPLMRAALASALADLATDVQFLEAANHAATLALIDASPSPDLLLMDLHMDGAAKASFRSSARALSLKSISRNVSSFHAVAGSP